MALAAVAMRLFMLLSLLTFAAAAPALIPKTTHDVVVPEDLPLRFQATGTDPSKGPFFDYIAIAVEYCAGVGNMRSWLHFAHVDQNKNVNWKYTFSLAKNDNARLRIHGQWLNIWWDSQNHLIQYSYENKEDACRWGQDQTSGSLCGMVSGGGRWSAPPLQCDLYTGPAHRWPRFVVMPGWINLGWGGEGQAHGQTMSSSNIAIESPTDLVQTADELYGYHEFGVHITEFCDGKTVKARGHFLDSTGIWTQVAFADGTESHRLVIDGVEGGLIIGNYDFTTSRLHFKHGQDCQWNQDKMEASNCGWCNLEFEQPWSNPKALQCANPPQDNPSLPRDHAMTCWVKNHIMTGPPSIKRASDSKTSAVLSKEMGHSPGSSEHMSRDSSEQVKIKLNVTEYCPDKDNYGLREAQVAYLEEGGDNSWYQLGKIYEEGNKMRNQVNIHGRPFPLVIGPYDFASAKLNFQYRDWTWNQDQHEDKFGCTSFPWSDPSPRQCGLSMLFQPRTHTIECYFDLGPAATKVKKAIEPLNPANEPTEAASNITDSPTPEQHIVALSAAAPLMPAEKADKGWAYYPFKVTLTEYCEASPGIPLIAKALWEDLNGHLESIKFDNGGNTVLQIMLNSDPNPLVVGPYDYYTAQMKFSHGGCRWDQDGDQQWCGYCVAQPWSQKAPLLCPGNAWVSRDHDIQCWVALRQ